MLQNIISTLLHTNKVKQKIVNINSASSIATGIIQTTFATTNAANVAASIQFKSTSISNATTTTTTTTSLSALRSNISKIVRPTTSTISKTIKLKFGKNFADKQLNYNFTKSKIAETNIISVNDLINSTVPDHYIDADNVARREHILEYCSILVFFVFSIIGFTAFVFFGVVRCLKTTTNRDTSNATFSIPINIDPEDQTLLSPEIEHSSPMLSVQSPGYAGMERFGVDAGLGSPPNHRRRMRSDSAQTHDILLSADSTIIANKPDNHRSLLDDNHHRHYCHHAHDDIIHCPHHIALPDSEWNPSDSNLQLRNSYQQAEITRSYIRPPPNKTALDVPYSFIPETSSIHTNHQRNTASTATINNNKSKHNPIAKFLFRISSPKSHENSNNSSSNNALSNQHTFHRNNGSSNTSTSSSSLSSSSLSSTSSYSTPVAMATASRYNQPSSTIVRTMKQSPLPPSYSESQLQFQQEQQHQQRIKFPPIIYSPSSMSVSSSSSSLRAPSSLSNNNSPKINKSKSLCTDINCSTLVISTTPTAMINSIVNNAAIIGSTTTTITPSITDVPLSASASITNHSSVNQTENINIHTDLDNTANNCMITNRRITPSSTPPSNSPSHSSHV